MYKYALAMAKQRAACDVWMATNRKECDHAFGAKNQSLHWTYANISTLSASYLTARKNVTRRLGRTERAAALVGIIDVEMRSVA